MPVIGIDHVQLAMPAGGEDNARRFFSEILGLQELPKPADTAGRGGLWYQCGPMQLHLGVQKEFAPALKAHPGLLVDRLEPIVEALKSAGYALSTDVPIKGFSRIFTNDPFGNRIELLERVAEPD
ncbi:glyoxalase [Paraburkholderia phenazinium]|jgi:catechol 2,3-dioxygenase-like lactoylglutathione lyase family enzyme|uniref:glyoxalase n=1 Tax=Paraburkholderia phenazinium TaxID=60549 RepID=UPI00158BB4B4|nr:glyoxalase [Paraburkholderia phenazinium]